MSADLSAVDDAQLARWAYGRASKSAALSDCRDHSVQGRQRPHPLSVFDRPPSGTERDLVCLGGEYHVEWGPTGGAQLDVRITEAQRLAMEAVFEAVFVNQPASGSAASGEWVAA
jgi:hypothetical protein